jgi:ketosteroid isomerase-like protein
MNTAASPVPLPVVERLQSAINAHDLDAIVACFADDYRNETPAHPDRSFTGPDQVRRNWSQILATVPDLHADLVSIAVSGDTAYCEWDWGGTGPGGREHRMRGVTITSARGGLISATRFYMEPVVHDGLDPLSAVRRVLPDGADGTAR